MAADEIYLIANRDVTITGVTNRLIVDGSVGTLEDSSIVQESDSGLVTVIERWPRRRRRWTVTWSARTDLENAAAIENLFEVNGRKYPFLFIPPRSRDYTITDHWFETGDGVEDTFQITRGVQTVDADDASVRVVTNNIYYPLDNNVFELTIDGDTQTAYTLGSRGLVTFNDPPDSGAIIRVTCQFAIPVRWDSETISTTMRDADNDEIRSATLVEDFE